MATTVNTRSPTELTEEAWSLIDQALKEGKMTMASGQTISLTPSEIVELVKWLSAVKIKKPDNVPVPEDFQLRATKVKH
mgnify:CR=1 FL=1